MASKDTGRLPDRIEVERLCRIFTHDLRNPLVNMKALLGEMRDLTGNPEAGHQPSFEEELADLLSMMEQSVERMDQMILGANDIYHAMFDEPQCESVDIEALLSGVEVRSGIALRCLSVTPVWADPLALRRMFTALIDYMSERLAGAGGEIRFSVERHGSYDQLTVASTGLKIDLQESARILGPFHAYIGPEHGAGMVIVRALAQAHGGDIRFTVEAGQEVRFLINLPCQEEKVT